MNATAWAATLAMDFERRNGKTVLARREHTGPLVLQKPLYPEGATVCHTIILHPPGGIAAGDLLEITAHLGEGAQALITTPGATRWYRSAGRKATQRVSLTVAPGAILEWLPQETLYFNGVRAENILDLQLRGDAVFLACELACLGRLASGERFTVGEIVQRLNMARDGKVMLIERLRLKAGSLLMRSPLGLAGYAVYGAFLASSTGLTDGMLERARALPAVRRVNCGITRIHDLMIARYLGASVEEGKQLLHALWATLRFELTGRAPVRPRIWET